MIRERKKQRKLNLFSRQFKKNKRRKSIKIIIWKYNARKYTSKVFQSQSFPGGAANFHASWCHS